jgi:hypothetical protein
MQIENLVKKLCSKLAKNDILEEIPKRELFDLMKQSKENVELTLNYIFKLLESKKHSQSRYNLLLLINEIIYKSNHFRQRFLLKSLWFINIMDQVVDPKEWHIKLKKKLKELVNEWNDSMINIPELIGLAQLINAEVDHETEQLELERDVINPTSDSREIFSKELRLQKYFNFFDNEYQSFYQNAISQTLQGENIQMLLIPKLVEKYPNNVDETIKNPMGKAYEIEINLEKPKYIESDETKIIFDSLRENLHIQNKIYKEISNVLKTLMRVDDLDRSRHENRVKELLDLKGLVLDSLTKSNEILNNTTNEVDSDEDEVFEEAESSTKAIPETIVLAQSVATSRSRKGENAIKHIVPTVVKSKGLKQVFGTPPIHQIEVNFDSVPKVQSDNLNQDLKELFSKAPIVEYDQDLEYWSKTSLKFTDISSNSGLDYHHRFLGDGPSNKSISKETLANMKKRVVYINDSEIVEYTKCGAPLKKGGFCERRDKDKCPFHGIKIDRNENGIPLDPTLYTKPHVVQKQLWETIESDFTHKNENDGLDPIVKKRDSVQRRILKKVSKLAKEKTFDPTDDHEYRDRTVFRWGS